MAPLCTTQYTATELARGAERIDATWEFHHAVYSRVFLTPIHEKCFENVRLQERLECVYLL